MARRSIRTCMGSVVSFSAGTVTGAFSLSTKGTPSALHSPLAMVSPIRVVLSMIHCAMRGTSWKSVSIYTVVAAGRFTSYSAGYARMTSGAPGVTGPSTSSTA